MILIIGTLLGAVLVLFLFVVMMLDVGSPGVISFMQYLPAPFSAAFF